MNSENDQKRLAFSIIHRKIRNRVFTTYHLRNVSLFRLLTESDEVSIVVNSPGAYRSVCVEIELDALAVNTLLQSHHVHDIEGTAGSVAFDVMPQSSLEDMLTSGAGSAGLASYDETALVYNAFR